jgi:hypothetical protein
MEYSLARSIPLLQGRLSGNSVQSLYILEVVKSDMIHLSRENDVITKSPRTSSHVVSL